MNTIDETLLKKDREVQQSGAHAEINSLRDLLVAEIKSIYWAEKELTMALPRMLARASSENLKSALAGHLGQTKAHVERLEAIFRSELEMEPESVKCPALEGLIEAAETIISKSLEGSVRDAAIITAAQKVEHFEIAAYGSLVSFAHTIGENNIADTLEITLIEEHGANDKLNNVAALVNVEADKDDPDRIGKNSF